MRIPSEENKTSWNKLFTLLKEFQKQWGHCEVPRNYLREPELPKWVRVQRNTLSTLTIDQIRKLHSIGFSFGQRNDAWLVRFLELERFQRQHGHLRVPVKYRRDPHLNAWITSQRQNRKILADEKRKLLDQIGFRWEIQHKVAWKKRFQQLKEFKQTFGHCNVLARWPEDLGFGAWVHTQRGMYRKGLLSKVRFRQLDSLSFDWSPQVNVWNEQYLKLKAFKEQHGHMRGAEILKEDPKLSNWISRQRRYPHRLTRGQKKLLQQLGFEWAPLDETWERRFNELCLFKKEFGHCRVPARWKRNPILAGWVFRQRKDREKLDEDRRRRLEAMGFDWDPIQSAWLERFNKLKEFKNRYGHVKVPYRWEEDPVFGQWVGNLRTFRQKGKLKEEQVKLLDSLGFDWRPRIRSPLLPKTPTQPSPLQFPKLTPPSSGSSHTSTYPQPE